MDGLRLTVHGAWWTSRREPETVYRASCLNFFALDWAGHAVTAAACSRKFVGGYGDDGIFYFFRVDFAVFDVAQDFFCTHYFVPEFFKGFFGYRVPIISDRNAGF